MTLTLGTLMGYANENNTNFNLLKGKKIKVEFKTVKKGAVLSIKNENGTIIYSGEIKNSGNYSRIFDLSQLIEGNYTTELEKDYEIIIKSFSVVAGDITFGEQQIIFKPVIRAEKNLILISKLNFEKKPIKINLYYYNDLIFSETLTSSDALFKRVYKLSQEEKGSYSVTMQCDNKHYTKNFNL
jgi:hypothetical protein